MHHRFKFISAPPCSGRPADLSVSHKEIPTWSTKIKTMTFKSKQDFNCLFPSNRFGSVKKYLNLQIGEFSSNTGSKKLQNVCCRII